MSAGIIRHDPGTYVECRLLVAHPDRPFLLAVRADRAWSLPVLTPLEHHPAAVGHLNEAIARLFGLETFVRRFVSESGKEAGYRSSDRLYELEVVGELARQRIRRTAWAGRTILPEMEFERESDILSIESWLDEYESDDSESATSLGRPPWSQPGWFEVARSWFRRSASGHDAPIDDAVIQQWTDDGLIVLSMRSRTGVTVMTASRADRDPDLRTVAQDFGWDYPELVEHDDARHWSIYRTRDRADVDSPDVLGNTG